MFRYLESALGFLVREEKMKMHHFDIHLYRPKSTTGKKGSLNRR